MIHIALALGSILAVTAGLVLLQMHWAVAVGMGLLVGLVVFFLLGRKMQEQLESLMQSVGKEIQNQKLDRAIELLKSGLALKHRHLFVEKQLNSQIGMLYYIQKKEDQAQIYLEKGFFKNPIAQGMLAALYWKRKDMEGVKRVMEANVKANAKEGICYGLYAWFLEQNKEPEQAKAILQKGLVKLPNDEKLSSCLTLLQNNKKLKMKVFGDIWLQFMLEKPPKIYQEPPPHLRVSRKAMFRG